MILWYQILEKFILHVYYCYCYLSLTLYKSYWLVLLNNCIWLVNIVAVEEVKIWTSQFSLPNSFLPFACCSVSCYYSAFFSVHFDYIGYTFFGLVTTSTIWIASIKLMFSNMCFRNPVIVNWVNMLQLLTYVVYYLVTIFRDSKQEMQLLLIGTNCR